MMNRMKRPYRVLTVCTLITTQIFIPGGLASSPYKTSSNTESLTPTRSANESSNTGQSQQVTSSTATNFLYSQAISAPSSTQAVSIPTQVFNVTETQATVMASYWSNETGYPRYLQVRKKGSNSWVSPTARTASGNDVILMDRGATGLGKYQATVSGLTPGQEYEYRIVTSKNLYSQTEGFKTNAISVQNITFSPTSTGAQILVTSDPAKGNPPQYILLTEGGLPTLGSTQKQIRADLTLITSGPNSGKYTANVQGLSPGQTYYARAYSHANNADGKYYSFKTLPGQPAPVILRTSVQNLTSRSADIVTDQFVNIAPTAKVYLILWQQKIEMTRETINDVIQYRASVTGLPPLTTVPYSFQVEQEGIVHTLPNSFFLTTPDRKAEFTSLNYSQSASGISSISGTLTDFESDMRLEVQENGPGGNWLRLDNAVDAQGNFSLNGYYPEGTHTLKFRLTDQTGAKEFAVKDLNFTVSDLPEISHQIGAQPAIADDSRNYSQIQFTAKGIELSGLLAGEKVSVQMVLKSETGTVVGNASQTLEVLADGKTNPPLFDLMSSEVPAGKKYQYQINIKREGLFREQITEMTTGLVTATKIMSIDYQSDPQTQDLKQVKVLIAGYIRDNQYLPKNDGGGAVYYAVHKQQVSLKIGNLVTYPEIITYPDGLSYFIYTPPAGVSLVGLNQLQVQVRETVFNLYPTGIVVNQPTISIHQLTAPVRPEDSAPKPASPIAKYDHNGDGILQLSDFTAYINAQGLTAQQRSARKAEALAFISGMKQGILDVLKRKTSGLPYYNLNNDGGINTLDLAIASSLYTNVSNL